MPISASVRVAEEGGIPCRVWNWDWVTSTGVVYEGRADALTG
jgi:hypothetical protein